MLQTAESEKKNYMQEGGIRKMSRYYFRTFRGHILLHLNAAGNSCSPSLASYISQQARPSVCQGC